MITIKDVAATAQVSIKTVSRVLNHEPSVAEATRQRVLSAVDLLGYVPNLSARRLKSGKSESLALILPRVTSPYASQLLSCVLAEARRHGYTLLVLEHSVDKAEGLEFVRRTLLHRQADGLLIAPPGADNAQLTEYVRTHDVPVVYITPRSLKQGYTCVEATDRIGALEATRYLLQLGHRRIAHVTGMMSQRFAQERLDGYLEALNEAAVPIDMNLIREGNNSVESGHEAACSLLDSAEPPTAFFAANDEMALGVMMLTWQRGLHIPNDVSIVGFDDIPLAQQVFPALTTVLQPIDEMARVAVSKLVDLIEGRNLEPVNVQIPTSLIIRLSCSEYVPAAGR
jgi:LacI family transcriptional regulator